MSEPELFFVFDADVRRCLAGWVVVRRDGTEVASSYSFGVAPDVIRDGLWASWCEWGGRGAAMASAMPWHQAAEFLCWCVNSKPLRRALPKLYVDLATLRLAAGKDPTATVMRLGPGEEPPHDPLADARQSARLLVEALNTTRNWRNGCANADAINEYAKGE